MGRGRQSSPPNLRRLQLSPNPGHPHAERMALRWVLVGQEFLARALATGMEMEMVSEYPVPTVMVFARQWLATAAL